MSLRREGACPHVAVTFCASLDQILNSQGELGAHLVLVNRWMWMLAGGEAGHEALHGRGTTLGPGGVPEGKKGLGTTPRAEAGAQCARPLLLQLSTHGAFIKGQRRKEGERPDGLSS